MGNNGGKSGVDERNIKRRKFHSEMSRRQRKTLRRKNVDEPKPESKSKYIDSEDKDAENINPNDYDFPFENLVFSGGGFKGLAYAGVLQYLEEMNLLGDEDNGPGQIRRFAGTSAGAMVATLVALGYGSHDIHQFCSQELNAVFLDGFRRPTKLKCLKNLWKHFGLNRGKKIKKYFGDKISAKSKRNNPDMTFYDLYKERGVELCVVVTNLNLMKAEFCHPKTTPDMPIRIAVLMSMAVPCIFAAVPYENNYRGVTDTYVDGGLLCNYPINCYDGWYLSMKTEDSFLTRLQPLSEIPTIMANRYVQFPCLQGPVL